MKKLPLYSLSLLWIASCLNADEVASEEKPNVSYEDKLALPSDELVDNEMAWGRNPYSAKDRLPICFEEEDVPVCGEGTHHVFFEEKASYFSPISKKIRDIYAKGIALYGFELTVPAWRFIYGWASGSYLSKVGHTTFSKSRTRVKLVPLGIGLKFVYTVKCFDLYAGIGGLGTYFHSNDQSSFVIRSTSKWAPGGVGKLGLFIRTTQGFFIDIFGDYSYMKFDFHSGSNKVVRRDVDFSGWSVGGGIGWAF